ncbi:MAG TPA: hypothetical protein VI386_12210 [Candidatus Sulfotelmatobacter sp.]
MADLAAVLEQLKEERQQAVGRLRKLEEAIAVLSKVTTEDSTLSSEGGRRQYRLSPAARERIAAAQRARWAKAREKSTK